MGVIMAIQILPQYAAVQNEARAAEPLLKKLETWLHGYEPETLQHISDDINTIYQEALAHHHEMHKVLGRINFGADFSLAHSEATPLSKVLSDTSALDSRMARVTSQLIDRAKKGEIQFNPQQAGLLSRTWSCLSGCGSQLSDALSILAYPLKFAWNHPWLVSTCATGAVATHYLSQLSPDVSSLSRNGSSLALVPPPRYSSLLGTGAALATMGLAMTGTVRTLQGPGVRQALELDYYQNHKLEGCFYVPVNAVKGVFSTAYNALQSLSHGIAAYAKHAHINGTIIALGAGAALYNTGHSTATNAALVSFGILGTHITMKGIHSAMQPHQFIPQ
jgi:hypothetical protein